MTTITPESAHAKMSDLFNRGQGTEALAVGLFYLADLKQGDFFDTPELNALFATILLHEGSEGLFSEYKKAVERDPRTTEDLKLTLTRDYANWLNRTAQYAKADHEIAKLHAAANARPAFELQADVLIEEVGFLLRGHDYFVGAQQGIRSAYLKSCTLKRNGEPHSDQYIMNLRYWLMIADALAFVPDTHAVTMAKELLNGGRSGIPADPSKKRRLVALLIRWVPTRWSRWTIAWLALQRYRLK